MENEETLNGSEARVMEHAEKNATFRIVPVAEYGRIITGVEDADGLPIPESVADSLVERGYLTRGKDHPDTLRSTGKKWRRTT